MLHIVLFCYVSVINNSHQIAKTSDDFLIMVVHQAAPMLTEDRVQECIDPKLGDQYPPAGALKVSLSIHNNIQLLVFYTRKLFLLPVVVGFASHWHGART